jgi:HSP20 family protein
MNQTEQPNAGIDDAIGQVEKLYRAVTGTDAPPIEAAYAPIPAEKDPSQHVEEQMNRLLELLGSVAQGPQTAPVWTPPVTVWESDSEILVCVDLPGLRREQVQLLVQGNTLTVSGSRTTASDGFRLRSSEGGLGAFRRTLFFPGGIPSPEPNAQIRDGVLEIRVPKKAPATATPRSVSIH